jgi:hypothetical protein
VLRASFIEDIKGYVCTRRNEDKSDKGANYRVETIAVSSRLNTLLKILGVDGHVRRGYLTV